MSEDSLHKRLRALIGSDFKYQGGRWTLIEVLHDEDVVVLRNRDDRERPVQADLYGAPLRRSQETLTLPINGPNDGFSAEMQDLLVGRIASRDASA